MISETKGDHFFPSAQLKIDGLSNPFGLDTKKITGNRTFWKAIFHPFTQKWSKGKKVNLVEKGNVISSEVILLKILWLI